MEDIKKCASLIIHKIYDAPMSVSNSGSEGESLNALSKNLDSLNSYDNAIKKDFSNEITDFSYLTETKSDFPATSHGNDNKRKTHIGDCENWELVVFSENTSSFIKSIRKDGIFDSLKRFYCRVFSDYVLQQAFITDEIPECNFYSELEMMDDRSRAIILSYRRFTKTLEVFVVIPFAYATARVLHLVKFLFFMLVHIVFFSYDKAKEKLQHLNFVTSHRKAENIVTLSEKPNSNLSGKHDNQNNFTTTNSNGFDSLVSYTSENKNSLCDDNNLLTLQSSSQNKNATGKVINSTEATTYNVHKMTDEELEYSTDIHNIKGTEIKSFSESDPNANEISEECEHTNLISFSSFNPVIDNYSLNTLHNLLQAKHNSLENIFKAAEEKRIPTELKNCNDPVSVICDTNVILNSSSLYVLDGNNHLRVLSENFISIRDKFDQSVHSTVKNVSLDETGNESNLEIFENFLHESSNPSFAGNTSSGFLSSQDKLRKNDLIRKSKKKLTTLYSRLWPIKSTSFTPGSISTENDQQLFSKPLPHFETVCPEYSISTRPLDDLLEEQQGRINFGFEEDSNDDTRSLFPEDSIQNSEEKGTDEYKSKLEFEQSPRRDSRFHGDSPTYELPSENFCVNSKELKDLAHSHIQCNYGLNIFDSLSNSKAISRRKHRISNVLKQMKKMFLPKCVISGRRRKKDSKK